MKRSELVRLIQEELESDDLTGDLKWVAEHIVGICERNGMNPPRYTGVFATGKKYNRLTDSGRDVHVFNGWEPEDEA